MLRVLLETEERASSGRDAKKMNEIINLLCVFIANLMIVSLFIMMLNPPYHYKGFKSWLESFLEEE